MGIVAVSAVERVAGGDDEGLDQVAGLVGKGMRKSCLNRKGRKTYEPDDDEMAWGDVSLG